MSGVRFARSKHSVTKMAMIDRRKGPNAERFSVEVWKLGRSFLGTLTLVGKFIKLPEPCSQKQDPPLRWSRHRETHC
jgi:hypothetical protein